MKHAFKKLLLALGLTAFCAAPFAVFDPVNDDTDLFRNNPNIPAERPNVLILLDNTANWSSGGRFAAEKTALINTVAALDSSFNVGIMIFTQGGSCTTVTVNGGYVRFGVRQLTTANKAALTSVVNSFTDAACGAGGDQGSLAFGGQAMHEAYLYFAGLTSRSGITQVKRDYAGSTVNTVTASLTPNPLSSSSATTYASPITDACAKNYIIFISNGPFDNGDDSPSSNLFANATTGLVPNASGGAFSSWVDEYAGYLANTGVNLLGSNQKIFTYAVEVDPVITGQGPAHTNLLKNAATLGKGKYFGITSANAGVALTDALLSIFTEIQAVNSVFAASTLPVSVNVRGTNLNQLYIGVFRPDAIDRPRWLGNLKAYQLKAQTLNNVTTVFTVDADLNPAINSSTGFITSNAKSFWTSANQPTSTYWSFRSAAENGVGGSSDSPDGDLVEKGGAAQQLRARYFAAGVNAASPSPSRLLYTCTQGSPFCKTHDPSNPSLLSATPFSTANAAIDAAALNLDARNVAPLTAKVTKTVSALIGERPLAITNAGAPIPVLSITTDSITSTVTLSNSRAVSVTAMSNNANVQAASCQNSGSNNTARVVIATGHGLAGGSSVNVVVPVNPGSKYNVTNKQITFVNPTTFTYTAAGLDDNAATLGCNVTSSNTNVVATAANHGFSAGQSVTIAGVAPNAYNGLKPITAVTTNSFTFAHTVDTAPTVAITTTATGATSTVTATTSGAFAVGTFSAGQQVTVSGETSGSSPSFNGTFTILSSPVPTTIAISYATSSAITTPSSGTITAGQSGLTATASVAGHAFIDGDTVTIAGASPAGFNGPFVISGTIPTVSFQYAVTAGLGNATPNPAITVSTSTVAIVTATLANHGYAVNDVITIAGVTGDLAHNNAAWTVASVGVPDASTFTYLTTTPPAPPLGGPGGSPTVRLTSNPKAYATITGHGYGANNTTFNNFTITGAAPGGYNVNNVTATVVDANTVSYVLTSPLANNTGATVSALTPSFTARATSTQHGFSGTPTVTIAGATPGAFNGPFTIAVTGVDTFEYTILSAQNDASGTITATASGGASSERDNVINWIRGEDNFEDENANSSFTDTRASMHGDVLHSRPSVVNYNRRATDAANIDNDVYIFYGGNDGVFRAVKGGFGSTTGDSAIGVEVWGFVAKEHFSSLRRLRVNFPGISSAFKKPYFFDGPIGAFTRDANNDGMLDPDNVRTIDGAGVVTVTPSPNTGDKVWLFLTMRRGGRAIYALDVSDPLVPKLLWRRGCPSFSTVAADIDAITGCDKGWSELGQTWSEPKVVSVTCSTTPCGSTDPVLIFGAGYDPLVEDLDPSTITASTPASVVSSGTPYTRSMGRGLFVVNAATGALIWHASPKPPAAVSMPPGATYKQVTGMDYAISSDIAVVVGDPDTKPFRAYVGDTGGNMWRFDFGASDPANWSVVKLASIADHATTAVVSGNTVIPGMRKFQFAPDVVGATGFDMVITGSGDREHPFDSVVVNRVYAFKDKKQTSSPLVAPLQPTIEHATSVTFNDQSIKTLLNVSTQCIEIPGACSGAAPEAAVSPFTLTAAENVSAALRDSTNTGWFITLAAGEKQVGSTLASGSGIVQFGTNQPSASAGGGACSPNLGVARQYTVNFLDGTAFNGTALSTQYVGGGFLPSPVLVFVGLGGATGTGTTSTSGVGVGGTITSGSSQLGIGAGASTGGSGNVASAVVCYGASCTLAPGTVLFSRVRKFWYKEID